MTTVYTKPGCPYSEAARRDLEEWGEPFVERDIDSAPPAVRDLARLGDGSLITPVIVQEDGVMRLGFGGA
jgi:glutaredoxin